MARMVSRPRQKEGRGIGERLSESFVFILLFLGLVFAVYWYFNVYKKSPEVALHTFMGAVKSGNVQQQYWMLTSNVKQRFGTARAYDSNHALGHGLVGRLVNATILSPKKTDTTFEADVKLTVRRPGQELYQASADDFVDHYVLKRESGAWKVDLAASTIRSLGGAPRR